jgi:hypothetical protein
MQTAQLADQAVIKGESEFEYPDNDNTRPDAEALASKKEDMRIREFIKNCKDIKELEENCKFYCEELSDDNELKKLYLEKLDELKLKE